MLRGRLIKLSSVDVDGPLDSFLPNDPLNFHLLLIMTCSSDDGGPGADEFFVTVCTPAWVREIVEREPIIFGHDYIIVKSYDHRTLYRLLDENVSACYGDTWKEVALKISQFARWEFSGNEW